MMRFNRPQPAAGFAMMVRAVDDADGAVPPPATRVFGGRRGAAMQSIGGRRLLAVTVSALAAAALLAVAGWMLLGGGSSPSSDDAAIQIIPPPGAAGGAPAAHSVAGASSAGASSTGAFSPEASVGQHPAAVSDPSGAPGEIAVYITGAVAKPGVYRVSFGERLDAVIELAGGPSQDADLSRINLAAYVKDAAHYRIPSVSIPSVGVPSAGVPAGSGDIADTAKTASNINTSIGAVNAGAVSTGEVNISAAGGGEAGATAGACAAPIDINSATPDCLQTLPGIGKVRAETIVAHREQEGPFPSVRSITAVSGIGEGIYGQIAELITARPR